MAAGPVTAADYRGETITGKRWRRAYQVTISNPYLGVPSVWFAEEQVTDLEGHVVSKQTDTLSTVVDLAAKIDLIDPQTGQPLGASVTQLDIYVALYSLYRALGASRDSAVAAAEAAEAQRVAQLNGVGA
jgi:hypothetical protein